jgi:hypothetical protein
MWGWGVAGVAALVALAGVRAAQAFGEPADYSYVKLDTAPDGAGRPGIPTGTGIYGNGA